MSTIAVTNLKHESATGNNIVLDSSGNVAFADGSASAPSITNDGDTNTGIYFPAADNIGFATNGVIRGRWTTDGLCFGSDTAAANALNDYEEGTFTAKFADANSGGNESSSTVSGKYTKIGNVVYFVVSVFNLSTAGLTSGNVAYITGFPFSNNSGFNAYAIPWTDTLNYDGYPMFQLASNQTYGSFVNCRDAATDTNVSVSAFTSGVSDVYINGFYYVS